MSFPTWGTYIYPERNILTCDIYVPRETQALIKNNKNLHVYYEKDNLCYLLKLLRTIQILKSVGFFSICLKTNIIR